MNNALLNSTQFQMDQQNFIQTNHYEFFYSDLIILFLYFLTMSSSVFGNAIACYVCLLLGPKSAANQFIGNMAISDLLTGVAIPSQWIFCSAVILDRNETICATFHNLRKIVCGFVSTYTLAIISYDR